MTTPPVVEVDMIDMLERVAEVAQAVDDAGDGLPPVERALLVGAAVEAFVASAVASAPSGYEADARGMLEAGIAAGRRLARDLDKKQAAAAVAAQALENARKGGT